MNSSVRPAPMGSENEIKFKEVNNDLQQQTENLKIIPHLQTDIIDQKNNINQCNTKDLDANILPPYEEWKISFEKLLEDEIGYRKFYEFLETEQLGVLFECWHSCVSYKTHPPNKATAKEVYSRFVRIKDARVPISDQARSNISLRLRANEITENILSEIEEEVYTNLRDVCYQKFLKSDFFNFFCETFGHLQYEPSKFHSFGKLNINKPTLDTLHEGKTKDYSRVNDDFQPSCLTPNEKEGQAAIKTEFLSLSPDAFRDSEKSSMTDSQFSCGMKEHGTRAGRNYHSDQLPDVPNFKPLTQRMNQERSKPLKPADFAALLTEKLTLVQREREEKLKHSSSKQQIPHAPNNQHSNSVHPIYQQPVKQSNIYDNESIIGDSDNQSFVMPPATDRYSIAGASSHSGSGIHQEFNNKYNRNVKEKAKGLWNAVHHSLRNGLGECNCQSCYERKQHARLYNDHIPQNIPVHYLQEHFPQHQHRSVPNDRSSHHHQQSQSYHSNSCHCSSCAMTYINTHESRCSGGKNELMNYSQQCREDYLYDLQPDRPPPIDSAKIYAWMEKNEQLNYSYPNPGPSPALRRKKQVNSENIRPDHAGQPIAQDPGMPLLPQPDAGNVLEEVKRKLGEDPNQRKPNMPLPRQSSARTHAHDSHQPQQLLRHSNNYYGHPDQAYNDVSYDAASMVSGWNYLDNSSAVSVNPSQVSTVPSSASRLWDEHGYYDHRHDKHIMDYKSEARSHSSTGRQSRHDPSQSHKDYKSDNYEYYSEAKSRSSAGRQPRYETQHNMDYKSEARSHSSAGHQSHSGSRARGDHKSKRSEHHSDIQSQSSAGRSEHSKRSSSSNKKSTVVTYFFGVEPIPYRIMIHGTEVTLGQFKAETKKGNYRFWFKTICPDDGETVFKEIKDDGELLPRYKDGIVGKVEKQD